MWNWLLTKLGKKTQSQRTRIQVDIPFEQHYYNRDDIQGTNVEEFAIETSEDTKES